MADSNQIPSTVGHKRGRSNDFPEPTSTLKKQRNDVDENDQNAPTVYQIVGFRQFISDPDDGKAWTKSGIYIRYYNTLKRGGLARKPLDFIEPSQSVRSRDLREISQENTLILFAIFFGLLPGITIRAAEDEIRTWMTEKQFVHVQEHLDAYFPWVQHFVARNEGGQKIQLPPPPFQVLGINALNTLKNSLQQPYPQQQQGSMGTASGVQTQGLSNGARGFNTGVQPVGHPTQFTNSNSYPIQPQPPQETQSMPHLAPHVHRQQFRDLLHSLSPQEREEQFQLQQQLQRKQQVEQRQTVLLCPETQPSRPQSQVGSRRNEVASFPENSTAAHHPQLPQQDNRPEQRSTPNPQPPKAVPQKAEGQPKRRGGRQPIKVTGDGTPRQRISARTLKAPAITQTQSDSAVPHNQNPGHNIQNISQYSQLANGQPGPSANATGSQVDNHAGVSSGPGFAVPVNPPIVPPAAFDHRLMHGIPDSIQRSATVAGYPTQPPRLEFPPVVHSASTSPISPIAIPTAKLTSTGNTGPYGTGINPVSADPGASSNERGWRHHSEQQPGAQATNPLAKNYSFVPVDPSLAQGNKTPPKNKASSSRPRAQRSAKRGATDSPIPQSVQPSAQRQEEEEEAPENDAAFGNGVYEFSVPFNSQQPPTQVQQPVNGGFAAALPQQNGFAPYATQPASLAPPQQQLQVQRPLSGATTPITPVPAPTTVPSSVAPIQQQLQAGTSASTSTSTPGIKGPVVALDSGPDFSFGSLGVATGGEGGIQIDTSQGLADGSGGLIYRASPDSELDALFDLPLACPPYSDYNPADDDLEHWGFNSAKAL